MLKERLIELIGMEGLNPNQFYLKTGLGNGFLNNVGETLRKPSLEKIQKAFPHWNKEYLTNGSGEKCSISHNSGAINTGTVGGDNVSIQGGDKPEIVSLKAEITRLEAIIASKDETIAAKDETIEILKNK